MKLKNGNFVEVAYGVLSDKYEYKKLDFESKVAQSSEKWEILTTSAEHYDTNQYAYKAVAFVNHETKEIHISSAGTNPRHM